MFKTLLSLFLIAPAALYMSACSENKNDLKTLTSIEITPQTIQLATDTSIMLEAHGYFSDGSTQTLKNNVEWSSANEAIARIDADGILYGLSEGNCTITASTIDKLPNGESLIFVSTSAEIIDATLLSITLEPNTTSLALGLSQQFSALGSYDANFTQDISNDVLWSSSNLAILSMNNTTGNKGLTTALSEGTATLHALHSTSGIDATREITVTPAVALSLSITPQNQTILIGSTQQYEATETLSDATEQNVTNEATWSSTDTSVATINSGTGFAEAQSEGSTTISATYGIFTSQTTLSVSLSDQLQILRENDGVYESVEAPYICDLESDCSKEINVTVADNLDIILKKFTLKAIGDDYKITDLSARDKSGVLTPYFDGLTNNQIIRAGTEQIFSLMSPKTGNVVRELEWSFSVDGDTSLYFIESYTFKSN